MKRAAVITASNRAFKGVYEDKSGQILLEGLKSLGYQIDNVLVLPDEIELIY
jgi:molybdopterin biosynthesis enzyme MoaB